MNNPRLAGRYAKSLLDLATEQNIIDSVNNDMKWLNSIHKSNPDFVAVLRSPIIKADAKEKIIQSITNGRINNLTAAFIQLLIKKGRENNLPEIVTAYIAQFNSLRNIHTVKITTATLLDDQIKEAILANLKNGATNGQTFEIETNINEELIGGFILETNGQLVDASIQRDLKDIKKQFMNNDYIHKLK